MPECEWIYHKPKFVCENHHPEVYIYAPWEGHRKFAYDYVRCIQPATIVELGSHYGGSAFAFLQAVKDGQLNTDFYAVDTWQGDDFTRSDYDENIFEHYRFLNETFFPEQHSYMLRMTFDEACSRFADGSIELLHIDGSHNYEEVKHDYLTWKDKVSENGVIFFHDIGEDLVFGSVMGSHIFWEELKACGYLTLEVPFSNGLGMLFRSEKLFAYIKNTVDFRVYQQYYNLRGEENKNALRESLFRIRDLKYHRDDLASQVAVLNSHLRQYAQESSTMKDYIGQLEAGRDAVTAQNRILQEHLIKYEAEVPVMKDYIGQLEAGRDAVTAQNRMLQEHLAKYEADVPVMKDYIRQLEKDVSGLNDFAASKERYIQELLAQKESLLTFAQEQSEYAKELEAQNAALTQIAEEKEVLEQKYDNLRKIIEKFPFLKLWMKDLC